MLFILFTAVLHGRYSLSFKRSLKSSKQIPEGNLHSLQQWNRILPCHNILQISQLLKHVQVHYKINHLGPIFFIILLNGPEVPSSFSLNILHGNQQLSEFTLRVAKHISWFLLVKEKKKEWYSLTVLEE